MMSTNNIVFICDDNYCMPTAVCIQSIISYYNEDSGPLTIHICTFGLTKENICLLNKLSSNTVKIVVDVFDSMKYVNRLKNISQRSHVTPTALIKFELAEYFETIDTILYLDSDIAIKDDISELLDVDVEKAYVAASYEFWNHIIRISYTFKRSVSKNFYFNSGVMLLNLKKMREDGIPEKLWHFKLNYAKTTLMDQESLNAICAPTAIHLSIKWNFNPLFLQPSYIKEINKVYGTNYSSLNHIEKDTCIIHYVGATDKPWKYRNAKLRRYWDEAYNQIDMEYPLSLKDAEIVKRPLFETIKDKISKYGLYGLICNMFYLFTEKLKNV